LSTYAPTSTKTGAIGDARSYIDQRHREREERELQRRLDYDCEYGPPGGVHRIMECEERVRHDVENR
jgi:hypothetical protein